MKKPFHRPDNERTGSVYLYCGEAAGQNSEVASVEELLAKQRLLVIAPHPDDEAIGSGGLIAKVKDVGGEAFVQVLTVGDLNHYNGEEHNHIAGETRRAELQSSMEYLGVDDYELVFNDKKKHLRLDQMGRLELVSIIEQRSRLSINKVRPTMVTFPAPSYNQDHEAVYKAAIAAARPHLEDLKPFQRFVLVSDAPQLCWGFADFRPNFYVDISNYLEKKLEAFRRHASQQRPDPHNGAVESLRYLALARGREISVPAAEAYECCRFVT